MRDTCGTYAAPAAPLRRLRHICDTCAAYATPAASMRHLRHRCDTCGTYATSAAPLRPLRCICDLCTIYATSAAPMRQLSHRCDTCGTYVTSATPVRHMRHICNTVRASFFLAKARVYITGVCLGRPQGAAFGKRPLLGEIVLARRQFFVLSQETYESAICQSSPPHPLFRPRIRTPWRASKNRRGFGHGESSSLLALYLHASTVGALTRAQLSATYPR